MNGCQMAIDLNANNGSPLARNDPIRIPFEYLHSDLMLPFSGENIILRIIIFH